MRYKDTQSNNSSGNSSNLDTSKNLILFEDYAMVEGNLFQLFCIERMVNKSNKRKIEYKDPVSFNDNCVKNVELTCLYYKQLNANEYKFEGTDVLTVKASDVLCHVNLVNDELLDSYTLPEAERELMNQEISKLNHISSNKETSANRN